MIGMKPKKASDKIPQGATVVVDLGAQEETMGRVRAALAGREAVTTAAGRRKAE
jgi:hypothetical protein